LREIASARVIEHVARRNAQKPDLNCRDDVATPQKKSRASARPLPTNLGQSQVDRLKGSGFKGGSAVQHFLTHEW
jgi:hypothetical protein